MIAVGLLQGFEITGVLSIAIGTPGLVALVISLGLICRSVNGWWRLFDIRSIGSIWHGAGWLGFTSVGPSALLLDVSIVNAFAGPYEAGVFAIGARLTAPLTLAASSIVAVLLPIAARSTQLSWRPSMRHLAILTGFLLFLATLFVAADHWVPWIFGAAYAGAGWAVRFYIANAALVLVTRSLVTLLQGWRRDKTASALVMGQVAFSLAGIAIGAGVQGATLAAAGVLSGNVLLSIALLVAVRKHLSRSANDGRRRETDDRSPSSR